MLDASLPLTTNEYDEWGNPNDKKYYDYMLSYSPYDQVKKQAYPNMLVTTGLHDSQVQYFEPAKWVAKYVNIKLMITYCCSKPTWKQGMVVHLGALKACKIPHYIMPLCLDLAGIKNNNIRTSASVIKRMPA